MTGDFGEALEAIMGIAFGGLVILMIAPQLNSVTSVNLVAWGVLWLIAGIGGGLLLVYSAVRAFTR